MKNLFTWLKPAPIQLRIVPSNQITLDLWRKDQALVTAAKRLEQDPTFQAAIAVLQNHHPRHTIFAAIGANPNDRIVHQAKIEGYELALNNLASLSQPYKLSKPLEATFQPS